MKRSAILALILSIAIVSACGKTEKGSRTAEGDVSSGAAGKQANARVVDLPADFPRDVPVLKGATVKVAMSQGKRMVVHLYTSSPVAEAAKFYHEALQRDGWQIESSTNAPDMSTLSARKGDTRCGVTVSRQGQGTLVRLAVSREGS